MNFLQRVVKRNALKQSKEMIKLLENAKRNGTIDPKQADRLINDLKISMEGSNDSKKQE